MKKVGDKRFWFRRNPRLAVLLFTVCLIFVILGIAEWKLRKDGLQPGVIGNLGGLEIVDSLFVYPDYIADEHGIMKINPAVIDVVNRFATFSGSDSLMRATPNFNKVRYLTWEISTDFKHFNERKDGESEFRRFIDSLKKKSELDEVERAYLNYSTHPINSDGFRSIEFKNYRTEKTKVLLLGDSFVWGMSSHPFTNSFADNLAARGYVVFNTGMAGVDPAQYLAIAKAYIPRLEPDVVIVNFFMGNDELDFYRRSEPFHPVCHYTNAGLLDAYPDRAYLDPQQAYKTITSKVYLPYHPDFWSKLLGKWSLTTKLWMLLHHEKLRETYHPQEISAEGFTVSERYIHEINEACKPVGAKMILVLIPFNEKKKWEPAMYKSFKQMAERVFKQTPYYYPDNLEAGDFPEGDDHFNNAGSHKYADFLQSLIDSVIAAK